MGKAGNDVSSTKKITISDLTNMLIGWVLHWCDSDANKHILEAVPGESIREERRQWMRWELYLAAISACKVACEGQVREALGDAGVRELEAQVKSRTIEACGRAGMDEVQLQRILKRLESTHADYESVLFAPDISSMMDLNRCLYTKLSENIFGILVEDAFLAFSLINFYMLCARGFEEAFKQFHIVRS